MPVPSLGDFLFNPAATGVGGIVVGAYLMGLLGQAGRDTWHQIIRILSQEWQQYRSREPAIPDDELKVAIGDHAKMVARTLQNAQNMIPDSRLALDSEAPYESARRQAEYVEDKLEQFKNETVPRAEYSFEEIQDAAKSRRIWNSEIDDLYQHPTDFADLRRLLILLEDVEAAIPSMRV